MKGLQVLFISCLAAAAFAQSPGGGSSSSSGSNDSSGSTRGGATGSPGENTRFFGGLLGTLAQGLGGGGGHHHGGFGGGHHQGGSGFNPGGFGGGFNQGGFGGGFNQGGFGGGSNQGGFGGGHPGHQQSCRYWCRTPQGQAYCCEGGNQPAGPVGVKPGNCPRVRPQCPPVRSNFGPPNTCSNDYRCGGRDKCCFDTCLQEHVCKPNLFGGFGGFGR